jgi:hypothetical protein
VILLVVVPTAIVLLLKQRVGNQHRSWPKKVLAPLRAESQSLRKNYLSVLVRRHELEDTEIRRELPSWHLKRELEGRYPVSQLACSDAHRKSSATIAEKSQVAHLGREIRGSASRDTKRTSRSWFTTVAIWPFSRSGSVRSASATGAVRSSHGDISAL